MLYTFPKFLIYRVFVKQKQANKQMTERKKKTQDSSQGNRYFCGMTFFSDCRSKFINFRFIKIARLSPAIFTIIIVCLSSQHTTLSTKISSDSFYKCKFQQGNGGLFLNTAQYLEPVKFRWEITCKKNGDHLVNDCQFI